LTFARATKKFSDDDSGRSRVATIDRQQIPTERLHPKAANSRCRPWGDIGCPDLVAPKRPLGLARRRAVTLDEAMTYALAGLEAA
jgi:hypothetical protein